MNWLATRIARLLWRGMIWLMRRPWIKRIQRASFQLFPDRMKTRARRNFIRQNRFARRHALGLLTFSVNLLLASILLTTSFYFLLGMAEDGSLGRPHVLDHVGQKGS